MKPPTVPAYPPLASPFPARSSGMAPPFAFPGVTMRVFPLRADMYVLRRFCERYLNVVPPEVAMFEPYAPYVYLIALHYGRMAVEAANFGWISQHEVTFSVPLLRYRQRGGRREFVDWAYVTPFIFVDNPLSLTTGREVYGWPKVLSYFERDVDRWLDDPSGPQTLMSMSTLVVGEIGGAEKQEVLLEIENELTTNLPLAPPSFQPLFRALTAVPRAALETLGLAGDLMSIWTAPPLQGYAQYDRSLLMQGLTQGFRDALPLRQSPYYNIVTQKQFRDARYPETLAYQALVMSRMTLQRFNQGGLLGDLGYVQGDLSGGFRVLIHRYATQTIVDILGLDVEREVTVSGRSIDVLRPVYPFWLDLDVDYGRGTTLCWRTRQSPWHAGAGDIPLPSVPPSPPGHLFNTAQGPTFVDIGGPQRSDDTTVHLLPLLADPGKLQEVVDKYLNVAPEICTFEAWGRYVFLSTLSFGHLASVLADLGSVSGRQLAFYIPIRQRGPGGRESFGLMAPFIYVDNSTAGVTGREVSGYYAVQAELASPPDTWMRGPSIWRTLLQVKTLLFPVVDLGIGATSRVLLEVLAGDPATAPEGHRAAHSAPPGDWMSDLKDELNRKKEALQSSGVDLGIGQNIARAIVENRWPFRVVTLKQIPDSWDADRAAYQELLVNGWYVDRYDRTNEIQGDLHLRIFRYPTAPIVETLGLKTKETGVMNGIAYDVCEVIQPQAMQLSLRSRCLESLGWRAGGGEWHTGAEPGCEDQPVRDEVLGTLASLPELEPKIILETLLGGEVPPGPPADGSAA